MPAPERLQPAEQLQPAKSWSPLLSTLAAAHCLPAVVLPTVALLHQPMQPQMPTQLQSYRLAPALQAPPHPELPLE